MRDFDHWFAEQGKAEILEIEEWPSDVRQLGDGLFEVECCCCHERVVMLCDISEHVEGEYYCGGSPRCCP